MGLSYREGVGVLQDFEKAYAWWSVAAANGYEIGKKNRDLIASKLSPRQLEAGRKLARELQAKFDSQ